MCIGFQVDLWKWQTRLDSHSMRIVVSMWMGLLVSKTNIICGNVVGCTCPPVLCPLPKHQNRYQTTLTINCKPNIPKYTNQKLVQRTVKQDVFHKNWKVRSWTGVKSTETSWMKSLNRCRNKPVQLTTNKYTFCHTHAPLKLCIVAANHNLQLHWWWV